MDWARDDAILGPADLKQVFKFEPKDTTVLRILDQYDGPVLWTLKDEKEWDDWFRKELPPRDGTRSGLVLILAKRTGEMGLSGIKKVNSDQWLQYVDEELAKKSASNNDLQASLNSKAKERSGGRRNLKVLPFSREVFLRIARKFSIHNSVVRTISRADIPVFSSADVYMGGQEGPRHPAYVYNCRTTNSWAMDLAFTATFFPHCGLTFGILFGCPFSIEKQIVNRLSSASTEVSHPLLMPGIFAELERTRQVHVVEFAIDEVETRILTVDSSPEEMDAMPISLKEANNRAKRAQWLDTTYLRNQLVSWNTQLKKLASHTDELSNTVFKDHIIGQGRPWTAVRNGELDSKEYTDASRANLRRVGVKIRDRVQEIIDEYDAKIRDCTMRVDGMAMATQWAQGETNVDIALATSRDSRHMRSIALLTMVFLPGTFFASIFSMTFFDWSGPNGKPEISSYVWVYVVIAVAFTVLTIGLWWYFVIYRQKPATKDTLNEEEMAFLS
ncbi:hypothetical protein diail_7624 [Diaporthe ilicicola]|nr:hypothetical protein diail_7624 [Diaporthe ilicicola]